MTLAAGELSRSDGHDDAIRNAREQTIADYLAVVRRYKWVIIVAVLVVPTVAYVMSAREPKVFATRPTCS